jgi:hypothetical protein
MSKVIMSEYISKNLCDLVIPFVERTRDGQIDVQRTQLNFTKALHVVVATEREDYFTIGKALREVFEANPEVKKIGMSPLIHYAMRRIEISDHGRFNIMKEKVANYVRNNPHLFKISSGKGGGVAWVGGEKAYSSLYPSQPPSSRVLTLRSGS